MSDPEKVLVPERTDDARAVKVRLAVVQDEERATVERTDEPECMSFPHLVLREWIAFLALSLGLVVLSLLVNAPLEEMANPEKTPNPSKAPWYFLGLQELLHYYPPLVAGVLLPGFVVLSLIVVPYFDINLRREAIWRGRSLPGALKVLIVTALISLFFIFSAAHPVWPIVVPTIFVGLLMALPAALGQRPAVLHWLATRSLPFYIFLWFLIVATALTAIGTLFRGPGWSFTLPWRDGIY
ncbi:MAG: hypothetical protein HYY93_10165 [Planctomycetes bacterium]|nr:hypothetical protein [Planctomycetota bacterium]